LAGLVVVVVGLVWLLAWLVGCLTIAIRFAIWFCILINSNKQLKFQSHPVKMVLFSIYNFNGAFFLRNLHTNHTPSNQFIYLRPQYKPITALKLLVWHNVPDGVFFMLESDCGVHIFRFV
jgi:hypothetical protein